MEANVHKQKYIARFVLEWEMFQTEFAQKINFMFNL